MHNIHNIKDDKRNSAFVKNVITKSPIKKAPVSRGFFVFCFLVSELDCADWAVFAGFFATAATAICAIDDDGDAIGTHLENIRANRCANSATDARIFINCRLHDSSF